MEDVFSVAYQQTEDEMDLEYAFFGIYDGHGGREAAYYAKEHLMDNITKRQEFWSESDELVLKAIREGFLKTQQDMWGDLENWAKTSSGLPSTAGTTASVAFIRRGKLFVGHVGDSGIVLGEQDADNPDLWRPQMLTRDHKPECDIELARIESSGGKVVNKSGVPRVVWNRPRPGHTGPVRRSTPVDEIPFLAVARALGDLWSYNSKQDVFVVSPDPDLHVYSLDISKMRCLVLATDGMWNVLSGDMAVSAVRQAEKNNERHMLEQNNEAEKSSSWQNPSKKLVDMAVDRWKSCKLRADNTSVVVVMLDPPGPPRAQVLRRQRDAAKQGILKKQACNNDHAPPLPPKPVKPLTSAAPATSSTASSKGLAIISRFPNSSKPEEATGKNLVTGSKSDIKSSGRIVHDNTKSEPTKIVQSKSPSDAQPHCDQTVPEVANPPEANSLPVDEVLQSPEVSSSGSDSFVPSFLSRVPSNQQSAHPPPAIKPRKSLSRELASLAIESPVQERKSSSQPSRRSNASTASVPLKRRGRSIDSAAAGRDDSDDENCHLVPVAKLEEVEAKCDLLNNKLKMMEQKVANKTELLSQEVRALRHTVGAAIISNKDTETPSKVLRTRNTDVETPGSGTKRKRSDKEADKVVKRERTTTWAGKPLKKPEKPTRVTRRSVGSGGLSFASKSTFKGRRSLNMLKKS